MSRTTTALRRSFFINLLVMVSAVVLLQACGGGGKKAPPVADAVPTGYYGTNGTTLSTATVFTDTGTPVNITDLQGMIYNGRLIMMSVAQKLSYDGTITVSGNSYTGSVTVYQNGAKVSTVPALVSGTIAQGTSVSGTLAGTGAGSGTFALTYANATPVDNSMVVRLNDWLPVNNNLSLFPIAIASLQANFVSGREAGTGSFNNCVFSGRIDPIPQTHLYTVNGNMTNMSSFPCTTSAVLTPAYSGFASLRQTTTANDTLVLTISNGAYSVNGEFDRQ